MKLMNLKNMEDITMNVEMITTLEQIKSSLSRAKSIADRRLREPFSNPVDISSFLLLRIDVVLQDIDETIKAEEDALEAYYQEFQAEKKDEKQNNGFSPLISIIAEEVSKAFNNCWVAIRASKSDGSNPEYSISIQPDGYTPNDVMLKLRSLGYAPTFKSVKEFDTSNWADFDVQANGVAFNLSSTVSSISPPELDRFYEPAKDSELPF
jgi:hypothetical protein